MTLREELYNTAKQHEKKSTPTRKTHTELVAEYLTNICQNAASAGNFTVAVEMRILNDGQAVTNDDVKSFAKDNDLDIIKPRVMVLPMLSFDEKEA